MLTVSLQLLLQPADLSGPGLQQGLGLLGPGGDLEAGASSGVDHLTTVHRELLNFKNTIKKAIYICNIYYVIAYPGQHLSWIVPGAKPQRPGLERCLHCYNCQIIVVI